MIRLTKTLKYENVGRIVSVLQDDDPHTIADIADKSGVSRVTVRKVLQRLEARSVVYTSGKVPASIQGGKPATLYSLDAHSQFAVGIHVTFDRMYGRLIDLNLETHAETDVALRQRSPTTPDDLDGLPIDELLAMVTQVFETLLEQAGVDISQITGVGFGGHGVTHFDRGIIETSPHNPSWGKNVHMRERITAELGYDIPVYVDNAIRFRTLAERNLGVLKDVTDGVVIHCSEGLIAGVMLEGAIRHGRNDLSGSIGHMKVNVQDEQRCACGGFGCLEMQVSPWRIAMRIRELRDSYPDSPLNHGEQREENPIEHVFTAAESGDPLALALLDEVSDWFAIAFRNITLMIDPDTIVMQGIYAHAPEYFRARLREKVGRVSLIDAPANTGIAYSELGEDSASLGAAAFVLSEEIV